MQHAHLANVYGLLVILFDKVVYRSRHGIPRYAGIAVFLNF